MSFNKKMYSYQEAYDLTLDYFKGDTLATEVWLNKYALKDENGNFYECTPEDMFDRLAKEFYEIEKTYPNPCSYEEIRNAFSDSEHKISIIPGGSVLAGLGAPNYIGSLSNCLVIDSPEDSYHGIMKSREERVQLMKRRCGVGVDISTLRPAGASVNNPAKSSTGPVSFMDVDSGLTHEVAQSGRRGALMITLSCVHPDVLDFIKKKQDLTKVTGANISVQLTNDFMEAVKNDSDYILHWPVDIHIRPEEYKDLEYGKLELFEIQCGKVYVRRVKAREYWNELIHCAWNTGEPGIMFHDIHINYSPEGKYDKYRGVTTNPCLTGDTKVAVADGRNFVTIKELVDEGKDVPVYCLNDEGKVTVSLMRNPRWTGFEKVYEIELENGHKFRCTENHKIRLTNNIYVEAKNLKEGDSLYLMNKYQANWFDIKRDKTLKKGTDYYFINSSDKNFMVPEHKFIYEYATNSKQESGYVIHHLDFNGLNNSPENLKCMTKEEHTAYHSDRIKGENNPIFKILSDPEKLEQYSKNMSEAVSGLKNGRAYSNISNEQYLEEGVKFIKELGRPFSEKEWLVHASTINFPTLSKFRQQTLGNYKDFSNRCAELANIEYGDSDVRLYKNYLNVCSYDKTAFIRDGKIYVKRICEECGSEYDVEYTRREQSFCSTSCCLKHLDLAHSEKRLNSTKETYRKLGEEKRKKQVEIYSKLKFNKGREITEDELRAECNKQGVKLRFGAKNSFKNFGSLKEAARNFNHKVISIKILDAEDVYNGTVDRYHNFFIGGFEETSTFGKPKFLCINNLQCGEIFMEKYDSCRLISLNLSSFVENPFTENATFNYNEFAKVVRLGLHISDDLVDAEIKCIDRIIDNIDSKSCVELDLWKTIRETGKQGRRCGLGITALGDMVAMMGYKFDSPEAFEFVEKVMSAKYKTEVETEVEMASERGVFYGFDAQLEKTGLFSDRLKENVGVELWKKYVEGGRRNVSWSTIAPTGSLSILTQTTSGIEPIFSAYYTRRKKCGEGDRVDFIDKTGQKFTEYLVIHPQLKKWFKINGKNVTSELGIDYLENMEEYKLEEMDKIFKYSPWYMSTANDIDWRKRTALQGMIQKYITHSISSTVNLPNSATEKDVADIYMEAYDKCLKGITVYRDGCRDGVLVTANKKCDCEKQLLIHDAPKRPKILPCDIKRFRNNKEKWIAAVGLYDGQPYEIFTGLSEKLDIPDNIEEGEIIKNKINETYIDEITGEEGVRKVSRYDLRYVNDNGEKVVVEGINTVFNQEFWNYGKLIAGILRHGMRIDFVINIIKSLSFTNDTINSWKNGIARILKSYCADGEVKGEVCPECGAKIIRENGCKRCSNCTWSACQ